MEVRAVLQRRNVAEDDEVTEDVLTAKVFVSRYSLCRQMMTFVATFPRPQGGAHTHWYPTTHAMSLLNNIL